MSKISDRKLERDRKFERMMEADDRSLARMQEAVAKALFRYVAAMTIGDKARWDMLSDDLRGWFLEQADIASWQATESYLARTEIGVGEHDALYRKSHGLPPTGKVSLVNGKPTVRTTDADRSET